MKEIANDRPKKGSIILSCGAISSLKTCLAAPSIGPSWAFSDSVYETAILVSKEHDISAICVVTEEEENYPALTGGWSGHPSTYIG
eukprot:1189284-Prorocentrum_minimum.AAC.1